jgi:hypothetical protein
MQLCVNFWQTLPDRGWNFDEFFLQNNHPRSDTNAAGFVVWSSP